MSLLHSLACTGEEIMSDVLVDSGVIRIEFMVVCKVMILYMFVSIVVNYIDLGHILSQCLVTPPLENIIFWMVLIRRF